MILINSIEDHLRGVLGAEPEDREIQFYKDLLIALSANPSITALSYEAISLQIIDRADTLIKKLLEKK